MKPIQHAIFIIVVSLFAAATLCAQSEIVYRKTDSGTWNHFLTFSTGNIAHETGNGITLSGTNRQISVIRPYIYVAPGATGIANYSISIWDECPSSNDINVGFACGDNGAELINTVNFQLDLSLYSGSYQLLSIPLTRPIDLSDHPDDDLQVTFGTDRSNVTTWAFNEVDPTIGSIANPYYSYCGDVDPGASNGCYFVYSGFDKVMYGLELEARPYPLVPATISLSNVPNQANYATLTAADIYIGDANFVPTQNITISQTSFTCAEVGEHEITVSIEFSNGEYTNYQTTVTVVDDSPPVVVFPPSDISSTAAPGECGDIVDFVILSNAVQDNCYGVTNTQISGLPSGSFFPVGTTTNTHRYTDNSGNETLVSYNIIVDSDPSDPDSDNDGIKDACDNCPSTGDMSLDFHSPGQNSVSVPHDLAFNLADGDFAFEAWVNPHYNGEHTIVTKGNGFTGLTNYVYKLSPDGRQAFALSNNLSMLWTYSDSAVPLNDWTHVAVSVEQSTGHQEVTFYLNGEVDGVQSYDLLAPYNDDTNPFFIGKQGFFCNCDFFDGSIDELAVWDRKLTLDEVRASMGNIYDGSESGLVAYYNFNDANACVSNTGNTTLTDLANNHDGTLSNFSLTAGCQSNWASGHDQLAPSQAICKNIKVESQDADLILTAADIDGGSLGSCTAIQNLFINGQNAITLDLNQEGFQLATLTAIDENGSQSTCQAEVHVIKDRCKKGDDTVDSDNAGLPDACDCFPNDPLNDEILLKNDINNGMDFDGIDDHLIIPNNPALVPTNNNSLTFEAWINPDEVSGFQAIATSAFSLEAYNLAIYLDDDVLTVTARNTVVASSIATLPVDTWTHVAVVFAANSGNPSLSTIKIYINGQLDTTLTNSFLSFHYWAPITIGDITSADWSFNGQMEDIRFWSTARTSDQINTLKDRELYGTEQGLEAYYTFSVGIPDGDNTELSVVKDDTDNNFDASLVGFAKNGQGSNWQDAADVMLTSVYRDDLVSCLGCPKHISMDFDGENDVILLDHDLALIPTNTNAMTFETWVYPEEVIDIGMIASSGVFPELNYQIFISDNKVNVTGRDVNYLGSNANIVANQWTHIAVSFDQTETRLYINGVLDNTRIQTLSNTIQGYAISIGSQANGQPASWNFEGKMDDTRFWSEARTAGQIQSKMNQELQGDEESLIAYFNYSDGEPNDDNSSINVVTDKSFNSRDGLLMGFAKTGTSSNWVSESPLPISAENAALYFDGTNDYLEIPYSPDFVPTFNNPITVEAWIYTEKTEGTSIIHTTGKHPNYNNQISLSDKTVFVATYQGPPLISNDSILPFEWTHIAVVFNMTETSLYINGKLDKVRYHPLSGTDLGNASKWGSQENGTPSVFNFFGKMDDLRTWDHARTASQIGDNMFAELQGAEPGLLAYYDMNEGIPEADNSAIIDLDDLTPNGNNATMVGFQKMGTTSNWVGSPIIFNDSDKDGTPDVCDNCVALKNLLLQNTMVDGIYRATETITLGNGLTFPTNANLSLRAPVVIVPQTVQLPDSGTIQILPSDCEE